VSAVTTLRLSFDVEVAIRAHAAETYPHECCGALLGRDAAAREVLRAFPLPNRRQDSPRNRFSLEPADVVAAERVAREMGAELVGWYHSHPDHPARPSAYDREHAWPWYSYVIVAVAGGAPGEMTSWRLADDRGAFAPEALETVAARAESADGVAASRTGGGEVR
jgi:proteasome lid subunit RPN8/RPN11